MNGSGPKQAGVWFLREPFAYAPTYITAYGINGEWSGASSTHTGGIVMCIKGDGSVVQVSESISWFLWVNLNGYSDGYESVLDQ